jgi:hypothetical protein
MVAGPTLLEQYKRLLDEYIATRNEIADVKEEDKIPAIATLVQKQNIESKMAELRTYMNPTELESIELWEVWGDE